MSRERLTSRTAEDLKSKPGTQVESKGSGIDNDAYNMNDTGHEKNDPKVGEYAKGDPSAWGEDVAAQNWPSQNKGGEKRDEMNVPALIDKHAAAQAVASAKRLEEKAVKCIIAAQRILPGATDELIEKQAAILMHLPEEGLNATLAHQEELAKSISKQAQDVAEEAKGEGESEEQEKKEKEVTKKNDDEGEEKKDDDDVPPMKKKESAEEKDLEEKKKKLEELKKKASELETEITAGQNAKANANWPTGKKKEKSAAEEEKKDGCNDKKDDKKEEKAAAEEKVEEKDEKDDDKKEEKAAAVEEKEEKDEDKKEEKSATEEVEASDANLLDQIFGEVTASETKKGATKLSGMVKKQASEQVSDLTSLWQSAPDVSSLF